MLSNRHALGAVPCWILLLSLLPALTACGLPDAPAATGKAALVPVVRIPTPPMIPAPQEIAKDGFVIDLAKPFPGTDLPLALGEQPAGGKDNALIVTEVIDHLDKLAPQASIVILQFPAGKIMFNKSIYLGDHGKRVVVLRGQGMGQTLLVNPSDDFEDGSLFDSGCPGAPISLYGTPTLEQIPAPTARPMVARQGTVAISAGDNVLWVTPKDYADAVVGEGLWFFSDDYYGPDNKRYKPAYGEAIYLKDKKVVDGRCELILETPAQETYYVGRGAKPPYGYDNYDGAIWVRGADIKLGYGYWKNKRTSFSGRFYAFEDMTMITGTEPGGHAHTGSTPIDARYSRCEFIASQSPAPYGNTVTRVLYEDCIFQGGARGPELSFFCRDIYFKNCTLIPMANSTQAHSSRWWSFQECSTDCLVDGLVVKANAQGEYWTGGGNVIKFTGKRCGFINCDLQFGDFKRDYVLVTVLKQISHAWPNGNKFYRTDDNYFLNNKVTIGAGAVKGTAIFRLVDAATNVTIAGNTFAIRSPNGVERLVTADANTLDVVVADNVYTGPPTKNEIAPGAVGVRFIRNNAAASVMAEPNPAVEVVPGGPQPGLWQSLSGK